MLPTKAIAIVTASAAIVTKVKAAKATSKAVRVHINSTKSARSKSPEPVHPETTEPAQSESPEPVHSETTEPARANRPEPVRAKSPKRTRCPSMSNGSCMHRGAFACFTYLGALRKSPCGKKSQG